MAGAKQVIALLAGHVEGNDERVYTVALQIAAAEARQGHVKTAETLRKLVDTARTSAGGGTSSLRPQLAIATPLAKPRGELEELVHVSHSDTRLADMTLTEAIRARLSRLVVQQQNRERLREFGQHPSSKLLLVGPPGSGKTLTASALAGELHLPLFTVRLEGVITRFLGESAGKLRLIFNQIAQMRGVYLFDEFDAIGGKRGAANEVGEMRRVLNSFLQFLEEANATDSVVVAATNHPELLDRALVRRFDEIIEYGLPDASGIKAMMRHRLGRMAGRSLGWEKILPLTEGLSQAELARVADEATKEAILAGRKTVATDEILAALNARRAMREAVADIFNDR
ncbi:MULTISPECIES: AAA family ATPase [Sphingomonadales]|jgi:SpoVK/Ycf46/Vps4 family AAA+-type ATPase|uniref:AAA family ATPase n=1 Tax=Novosphingobium soli TaxID=574956 RepID=A0ABV6D204_9SPHN|nr:MULTISPECIES: ATP-binding protein [Sphingomonadaceae]